MDRRLERQHGPRTADRGTLRDRRERTRTADRFATAGSEHGPHPVPAHRPPPPRTRHGPQTRAPARTADGGPRNASRPQGANTDGGQLRDRRERTRRIPSQHTARHLRERGMDRRLERQHGPRTADGGTLRDRRERTRHGPQTRAPARTADGGPRNASRPQGANTDGGQLRDRRERAQLPRLRRRRTASSRAWAASGSAWPPPWAGLPGGAVGGGGRLPPPFSP